MKKVLNYLTPALCIVALACSVAAFSKACTVTSDNQSSISSVNNTPAGQPVDLTYAAEKALPSVVHIKYVQNSRVQTVEVQSDPFEDFFNDPFGGFFGRGHGNGGTQQRRIQTPKKEATGSGVIISEDGYIVTNNHVVSGADELTVTLNDNKEFSARIIGTDETTDLALIKIDGKKLPAITIASSEDLKVSSPYNTYLSRWLTPGPICSPSVDAIRAALYPDQSFIQDQDLYFCSKDPSTGELHFSRTLSEHEAAVQIYAPLWQAFDRERGLE